MKQFFILLFLFYINALIAQIDTNVIVLTEQPQADSLMNDSLLVSVDSIPDSLTIGPKILMSKDSVDAQIDYGALDSMIMDNVNRVVHLYGQAYVNYTSLNLKAGYIRLDLNDNIALAEGIPDSIGNIVQVPVFKDGGQEFEADRMRYNFKNRKGVIYDVKTKQGDLNVLGAKTKFYGQGQDGREDHLIYNSDAIFTTCSHDPPHFGIRSRKQKIIPDKVALVGPSNLEIAGVPTPLWLPFGAFPLKIGKRPGVIFPREYEYSKLWGFGLSNIGYYQPINEYMGFTVLSDIYFRGSFGLKGTLNYKKRYKYNGSINLGYSRFKEEVIVDNEDGEKDLANSIRTSYSIKLNHRQDATAHPTRSYGGSINIETSGYDRLNNTDYNSTFNNTLYSNFNVSQSFPGTPFSATASMTHSQNTKTRSMNMTFPNLSIRMRTINPFKRKKSVGDERWYEKITLGYNSDLRYRLDGIDSTFFKEETFDESKFGVQHKLNSSLPFNFLKYFKISPNVSFKETWYTKKTDQFYVDVSETDSITGEVKFRDSLVVNRIKDFNALHEFSAGVGISTSLFSTLQLQKGWLRGLRYTMKPSVSLNYSPDYTDPKLGYLQEVTRENPFDEDDISFRSRYQNEIFGAPSTAGKSFALNYSITHIFEGKFFNKKDSTFKKTKLFNNISMNGGYNFVADSLNWRPISVGGNARFFNDMTTFKISGTWDVYDETESGKRINTFYKDSNGKLLRFDGANFGFRTSFTFKKIKETFFKKKEEEPVDDSKKKTSTQQENLFNLIEGMSLNHTYNVQVRVDTDGKVSFESTIHNVSLRGTIPLSPKWNFTIGNIAYDFKRKRSTYPDLSISRDLHCWIMGMRWQPEAGTYSFFLNVKPGSLDFIKLPYKRNRADGAFEF